MQTERILCYRYSVTHCIYHCGYQNMIGLRGVPKTWPQDRRQDRKDK